MRGTVTKYYRKTHTHTNTDERKDEPPAPRWRGKKQPRERERERDKKGAALLWDERRRRGDAAERTSIEIKVAAPPATPTALYRVVPSFDSLLRSRVQVLGFLSSLFSISLRNRDWPGSGWSLRLVGASFRPDNHLVLDGTLMFRYIIEFAGFPPYWKFCVVDHFTECKPHSNTR